QDAGRTHLRHVRGEVLDLALGYTVEIEALGLQQPQHLGMRVSLDRIERARDGTQSAQGAHRGANRRRVVEVSAGALPQRAYEIPPPCAPPLHRAGGRRPRAREQLLPRRAEDTVRAARSDEQLVQLLDQAISLALIDHEREVQIVGRLADEVDLLL